MLPPEDEDDDLEFLPVARLGNKIEPLIDGERIFPALEEAMADAKESIYCTFWSIYPDTPLLSKKVRTALKVNDWQGLLMKIAKDNHVKVRIILSDFDPILFYKHHQERAWNAFNKFVGAATKARITKDQFQLIVSRHPAFIGGILAHLVSKKGLAKVVDEFNKHKLAGLENSPGIWGDVKVSGKKLSISTHGF